MLPCSCLRELLSSDVMTVFSRVRFYLHEAVSLRSTSWSRVTRFDSSRRGTRFPASSSLLIMGSMDASHSCRPSTSLQHPLPSDTLHKRHHAHCLGCGHHRRCEVNLPQEPQ
ncbi:uncharacterized protein LOC143667178 isoform X3 [Tamandua tetradactyla]|uniref:uncharacterized protein LOC143667178 isoform X3 n=1 Tax=Tamandua tetradactyla TaxID=48850 RepID=UPI004053CD74